MTTKPSALAAAIPLALLAIVGPAAADGFDEGQAKATMEAAGYAEVSAVHQGNLGDWMARAMRDGRPVMIVLHPDGTVALRQDEEVPPAKPVGTLPELKTGKP